MDAGSVRDDGAYKEVWPQSVMAQPTNAMKAGPFQNRVDCSDNRLKIMKLIGRSAEGVALYERGERSWMAVVPGTANVDFLNPACTGARMGLTPIAGDPSNDVAMSEGRAAATGPGVPQRYAGPWGGGTRVIGAPGGI